MDDLSMDAELFKLPPRDERGPSTGERRRMLASVYLAHWKDLCRYVQARFGAGPPEPEDVAQAAFMKFASLDAPHDVHNPRAYLYATARNYVADERRRRHRHDGCAVELRRLAEARIVSELSPERASLDRERYAHFAAALEKLPATHRRLILLNRFEGLSCTEIGRRFGMSGAAVQKRIERALAECLRHMQAAERGRGK